MKKSILVFLFLLTSLYAQEREKFHSNYGLPSNNSLLANFKDARVAISLWIEELGKSHGGELNVKFYDDINFMYKKFLNTEALDMIVVDLPFYFENKKQIDRVANNLWSISYDKEKYIQYYFITNKRSKIKGFEDLEDKSIAFKLNEKGAEVWLEKNSYRKNKKSFKKIIRTLSEERKESTALLKVFFNKVDSAIVSSRTWNTMVELNPAIKKRVNIVDRSAQIHLPFIGFFSKKANKGGVNAFFDLGIDMKNLPESEQIVTLLKFDEIFRVDKKSIDKLQECYNEYYKLKKRYK